MGGRRPAGAGSVEAPESNTCLPAPDISLVAAVRDWVRRANGPITTNGLRLGRQLETAKEQFATQLTCRGIDENKCIQLLRNHQTLRRRSARVLRDIRLQRDEARARRHLRLRARIQSLPQMPNPAPAHLSGEEVSQNITILEPVELPVSERHQNARLAQTDGRSLFHLLRVRRNNFCWST